MTLESQKLMRRWAASEARLLAEDWRGAAILHVEGDGGAFRVAILDEQGDERSIFRDLSRGAATRVVSLLESELPKVGIPVAARMCTWATEHDSLLEESFAAVRGARRKKIPPFLQEAQSIFEALLC